MAIPKIKADVEIRLNKREAELAELPRGWNGAAEALGHFICVSEMRRQSMKLLMQGENDEFPDEKELHYAPRLHEIFQEFEEEVRNAASPFLSVEYTKVCASAMEEARGVSVSNITSPRVVHHLVKGQVARISATCAHLADRSFAYASEVSCKIAGLKTSSYPLHSMTAPHRCWRMRSESARSTSQE